MTRHRVLIGVVLGAVELHVPRRHHFDVVLEHHGTCSITDTNVQLKKQKRESGRTGTGPSFVSKEHVGKNETLVHTEALLSHFFRKHSTI